MWCSIKTFVILFEIGVRKKKGSLQTNDNKLKEIVKLEQCLFCPSCLALSLNFKKKGHKGGKDLEFENPVETTYYIITKGYLIKRLFENPILKI